MMGERHKNLQVLYIFFFSPQIVVPENVLTLWILKKKLIAKHDIMIIPLNISVKNFRMIIPWSNNRLSFYLLV